MKKYILPVFAVLCSVFVVLFIVLIVHIVRAPSLEIDNATTQIARLDFEKNISPMQISAVKRQAKSTFGVTNPSFIEKNKTLVFFYKNTQTTSEAVQKAIEKNTGVKGSIMKVSKELAKKGVCPVMQPNSFKYKFSLAVQRIFK